ncbi:hypothetical protein AALO_G00018940 [Alosa alosa]|uniref:Peptidase A2 domain-containing protein n=1 Tax=Alosa alosa TaxID=278164 RepID=A0AAV6HLI7_9TELE|nr:hypothetical protein AALO_G00018940 [Alosa alosa]
MSSCPHLDVTLGGVTVSCLIDTGSMVSTVTESFFLQHFEPWGQQRLQSCHWLQLRAANGLAIPYIGYLELDVELCGKLMPKCGVLVVKDPPGGLSSLVPGVLGMNVLCKCYQELFGQHGSALFDLYGGRGVSQHNTNTKADNTNANPHNTNTKPHNTTRLQKPTTQHEYKADNTNTNPYNTNKKTHNTTRLQKPTTQHEYKSRQRKYKNPQHNGSYPTTEMYGRGKGSGCGL